MLRIGIIGSGFGLYGLLPAFHSIEQCHVVAFCGKKTERVLHYCNSIGLKNIYTDWERMLEVEKLDALALAVPPSIQYTIAKYAIKKGLHIFGEKPLAATLPQAKELARLVKEKNVTHVVDFIFPEIDEWQKVKDLIDTKHFGLLKHILVNWDFLSYDIKHKKVSWKTDITQGGGALSFYFSHTLYYLEYFAGKIKSCKSMLTYSQSSIHRGDTSVDVLLQFEIGVKGYAHLNCAAAGMQRHQVVFQCEKGTIILENNENITGSFTVTLYGEDGKQKTTVPRKNHQSNDEDERVKIVKKLAERFIAACVYNQQITPSFFDGLRVQTLIEKIRKDNEKSSRYIAKSNRSDVQ